MIQTVRAAAYTLYTENRGGIFREMFAFLQRPRSNPQGASFRLPRTPSPGTSLRVCFGRLPPPPLVSLGGPSGKIPGLPLAGKKARDPATALRQLSRQQES